MCRLRNEQEEEEKKCRERKRMKRMNETGGLCCFWLRQ